MQKKQLPKKDYPDLKRPFCEFGAEEYERYGGGEGVLGARGGVGLL